jgi:hypothetical protein
MSDKSKVLKTEEIFRKMAHKPSNYRPSVVFRAAAAAAVASLAAVGNALVSCPHEDMATLGLDRPPDKGNSKVAKNAKLEASLLPKQ